MTNSAADSSYYGLGTHEWIGIILPYKSQELQQQGLAGFGIRRRVAIMGYHPTDVSQIPDDQIVFALVALPTTSGTGAAGRKMSVRLTQGDIVLGKFLDGDAKQNPIILYALGRTQSTEFGSGRFDVKSGFVGSVKPNNLNAPNPKTGTPSQQFNTDVPEETNSNVAPGTQKQGRSNTKAKEQLKKAGIESGKVGALPEPKKLTLQELRARTAAREALPENQIGAKVDISEEIAQEARIQERFNSPVVVDDADVEIDRARAGDRSGLDDALNMF